jgi:hypothetical protein
MQPCNLATQQSRNLERNRTIMQPCNTMQQLRNLQRNNHATLQHNNNATLQRNNNETLQRNNHATLQRNLAKIRIVMLLDLEKKN